MTRLKKYLPQLCPFLILAVLAAFSFFFSGHGAAAQHSIPAKPATPAWKQLGKGLALIQLDYAGQDERDPTLASWKENDGSDLADLAILRINPEQYEFTLHMASEDGKAKTLPEFAHDNGLSAATNAGMYLTDNLTSTGYLKSATHVNNSRIASSFGAFFLAEPLRPGLPKAALLERNELGDNIKAKLDDYAIVVQNYRLTNSSGHVLWKDKGQAHSSSALSRDKKGNIIMIICRHPLTPSELARSLLSLRLGLNLIMYLEGGKEAGLVLRPDPDGSESHRLWPGRNRSLMGVSLGYTAIPNAIGLRHRNPADR